MTFSEERMDQELQELLERDPELGEQDLMEVHELGEQDLMEVHELEDLDLELMEVHELEDLDLELMEVHELEDQDLELMELHELGEQDLEDCRVLGEIPEDEVSMIEDLVLMSDRDGVAQEREVARDELIDSSLIGGDAGILAHLMEETGEEEVVGEQGRNSLASLGLDERLVRHYSEKGLRSLYDWQYDCIAQPGVLQGRNLVYSAPTSGGKTLVSELLMYKRVLEGRRAALVVFPFVSLVSEKKEAYYRAGGEVCGLKVSEFHHGSKSSLFEEFDIGVATIEKANALVNYYIQRGVLFERLGIIVVDELHLLGDEQRGYILEVMLTKVRLLSKLQAEGRSIQIVGMSATLPNLRDIGLWLDAVVYQSDFRPVPLREHIVLKGRAYVKPGKEGSHGAESGRTPLEMSALSRVQSWDSRRVGSELDPADFDLGQIGSSKWRYPVVDLGELLAIGWEALRRGESVLVFCPSKFSVESTALFFARCIRREFCEGVDVDDHSNGRQISESLRRVERQRLMLAEEIRQGSSFSKRGSKNSSSLVDCLVRGVGFHHSGLSHAERRIVEKGYRSGALSLLTATSTLAAGVNLPSRRVIFRGINIGRSFLTCVDYRQMSGRAGRAGQKGAFGESFILVNEHQSQVGREVSEEVETALELITADMKPLMSSFFTNSNGVTRLILEILAILLDFDQNPTTSRSRDASSESTATSSVLGLLTESTLMHHQAKLYCDLSRQCLVSDGNLDRALEYLLDKGMIASRQQGQKIGRISIGGYALDCSCTPLGKAIVSSGLSPSAGLELYEELRRSMESAFLGDLTYMSYLVAPFPPSEASDGSVSVHPFFRLDWKTLYDSIKEMSVLERHSLVRLGFDLEQISWASQLGRESLPPRLREPGFLRRHQRLLASQILRLVLSGQPVEEILSRFRFVTARDLQQLHTASLSVCISCLSFCQSMNWQSMQVVLQGSLRRLQAVTLLEEYSGTLTRDLGLEKSARKLTSGLAGFSVLSALELRSTLSVKTPNQLLAIPRRVLVHDINNRLYSGGRRTLQFVGKFVSEVFSSQTQSSKKRVPFYNRSAGPSSVSPDWDKLGSSENANLLNLADKQQLGDLETDGSILRAFSECESAPLYGQTGQEGDILVSSVIEELSILAEHGLSSLDSEKDCEILDALGEDELQHIDWEERLLLWSTPLQQSQGWEADLGS